MKLTSLIPIALISVLAVGASAQQRDKNKGAPRNRPNIIFFINDDQVKEEVGCYGCKVLTPHLDRLAREGMRKDNAHVVSEIIEKRNHRDKGLRPDEEDVRSAIKALGKSGRGEAVKPLMKIIFEDRNKVALRAYGVEVIEALAEIGPKADPNIPHILLHEFIAARGGANHETTDPIRVAGIGALLKIGPEAVPDVIMFLGIPRSQIHSRFNWNLWGQRILRRLGENPENRKAMGQALISFAKKGEYKPQYTYVLGLIGPEKARETLQKMDPSVVVGPTLDIIRTESGNNLISRSTVLRMMADVYAKEDILQPLEEALMDTVASRKELIARSKTVEEAIKAMKDKGEVPGKEMTSTLNLLGRKTTGATRQWTRLVEAAGIVGEPTVPILLKQMAVGHDARSIADKIGAAASGKFDELIPTRVTGAGPVQGTGPEQRGKTWNWPEYLTLARVATPECRKYIAELVKSLEVDDYGMVHYIGMVLDRLAPDSIEPVAALLDKRGGDWYGRWAATAVLELMGPKASDALPKLRIALEDEDEDVDVRVGAARAIARITGVHPFELYQKIPDVENRIIAATKEKTRAWRESHNRRKGSKPDPGGWDGCARWLYCMSSKQQLEQVNDSLTRCANQGGIGSFMGVNWVRVLRMFGSTSRFYPDGRLDKSTEEALLECFFKQMDKKKQRLHNANLPMNKCSRSYLTLEVMKDHPKFRNRTFSQGDTVQERYEHWRTMFIRHLEHWVANGLWSELGSSNYEYHTYPSYMNLAELSSDPDVRRLATMFMDLALVEAAQLEFSGVRGGAKCRAKRGGLGSTWNPYKAMLYGRRGATLYHASFAVSNYHPPDAAILLHKLGPREPISEMVNVYGGRELHPVNYAYRTPEYITGCVMNDPNRAYGANTEGRWSGVIFRDLTYVGVPAYCTEKWNVQRKDVRIFQGERGAYYGGWPRVNFSSGLDLVEKDGWIFTDNGEAYCAVNVLDQGYFWADPSKSAIYVRKRMTPIVMQTGSKKDYGSFENFQKAILKAPLTFKNNIVSYDGPKSEKLEFSCMMDEEYDGRIATFKAAFNKELVKTKAIYEDKARKKSEARARAEGKTGDEAENFIKAVLKEERRAYGDMAKEAARKAVEKMGLKEKDFKLPKINGKTIDVDPSLTYSSPYLQSEVDSGMVTMKYGSRKWIYDIAKREIVEVADK